MSLRTARERAFQTLLFEVTGVVLVTPLYAAAFGKHLGESALVVVALSAVLLVWAFLHNLVWDRLEWRCARRVSSNRCHRLRLVHAASYEISAMVVTLPVLIWFGGHGLLDAIAADIGLSIFDGIWAYLFFLGYDRLRPVRV